MSATWEYEAADPEVGILTDDLTHTCPANEADPQSAVESDVAVHNVTRFGRAEVAVATTFTCPACGATTAYVEHWPVEFFAEPRDEEEGR